MAKEKNCKTYIEGKKNVIDSKSNIQVSADLKRLLKVYSAEIEIPMGEIMDRILIALLIDADANIQRAVRKERKGMKGGVSP